MFTAYVDGSFFEGVCGWGVVVSDGPYGRTSVVYEANGIVEDDRGSHQIGGELKAAMVAICWAINKQITELEIAFDYLGVRNWVTGEWGARKELPRLYRQWVLNQVEKFGLMLYWTHVRAHQGDPGNERADRLASEATRRKR